MLLRYTIIRINKRVFSSILKLEENLFVILYILKAYKLGK